MNWLDSELALTWAYITLAGGVVFSLGFVAGSARNLSDVHAEAVRARVAHWSSDKYGNPAFMWLPSTDASTTSEKTDLK